MNYAYPAADSQLLPPSSSAPILPSTSSPYQFHLQVVQQPERARMCGFGDKDRRQISPPPGVRLHIFNTLTGQEITADEVLVSAIDTSFYVLMVELWSVDGQSNLSLIDTTNRGNDPCMFYGQHPGYLESHQYARSGIYPGATDNYAAAAAAASTTASPHTQNLLGSLASPAFKLLDLNNTLGIWFVLQDLSVRTEGVFRLKFSFINLADAHGPNPAPILCQTFSEPFQSFSAKTFPGVVSSTPLSRRFATQGIKLSIRREKSSSSSHQQAGSSSSSSSSHSRRGGSGQSSSSRSRTSHNPHTNNNPNIQF